MVNLDQAVDKVIIFLVIIALVPGALVSYFNVSTAGWDADRVIYGLLGRNNSSHLGNTCDNLYSRSIQDDAGQGSLRSSNCSF